MRDAPADGVGRLAAARDALTACAHAIADMRSVLVHGGNRELAALAGQLSQVRALAGAGLVAVTAEAVSRGIVAESQYASSTAWLADAAWHSRREAATLAKAAALVVQPDLAPVADAISTGDIDPASAVVIGSEYDKLSPDLIDEAKPVVLGAMVDVAYESGPGAVRRLKDEILARYGTEGHLEEQAERHRRHIELSCGRQTLAGLWDYRLTLDGESRALLEAAIGPGSAPQPHRDTGARDIRPVGRRRCEALIDSLRRAGTATSHVPTSPKATLMVTIDANQLARRLGGHSEGHLRHPTYGTPRGVDRGAGVAGGAGSAGVTGGTGSTGVTGGTGSTGSDGGAGRTGSDGGAGRSGDRSGGIPAIRGGTVLGTLASGQLLTVETVRRIACDASVIPVLLGSRGEILDQGIQRRLFNTAQVRALWLRDMHCTFPGCDTPAAWSDAHHLVHWADGGKTDLNNAALLCARHHTVVHRDQLAGTVDIAARRGGRSARGDPLARDGSSPAFTVRWDLRPGSYQGALPRTVRAQDAAA